MNFKIELIEAIPLLSPLHLLRRTAAAALQAAAAAITAPLDAVPTAWHP